MAPVPDEAGHEPQLSRYDFEHFSRVLAAVARAERPTLRQRADVEVIAGVFARVASGSTSPRIERPASFASSTQRRDWAGVPARLPAGPEGLQHAFVGARTACGLPEDAVEVWRHRFDPTRLDACPACRDSVVR